MSYPPTGPRPVWRMAEFRSSSTPGHYVLMHAEGLAQMREWEKRSDFIGWASDISTHQDVQNGQKPEADHD